MNLTSFCTSSLPRFPIGSNHLLRDLRRFGVTKKIMCMVHMIMSDSKRWIKSQRVLDMAYLLIMDVGNEISRQELFLINISLEGVVRKIITSKRNVYNIHKYWCKQAMSTEALSIEVRPLSVNINHSFQFCEVLKLPWNTY